MTKYNPLRYDIDYGSGLHMHKELKEIVCALLVAEGVIIGKPSNVY